MAGATIAGLMMEQSEYEQSLKRARAARSYTKVSGTITKDFQWWTHRWCWFPEITERVYHGWNQDGGPALVLFHRTVYWFCCGWSEMETLDQDDPRGDVSMGGEE